MKYEQTFVYYSNLVLVLSIKIEPIGAVKIIDITARERIKFPDASPYKSGIEPIAAWTVALGV